jgi:hypothetical protein
VSTAFTFRDTAFLGRRTSDSSDPLWSSVNLLLEFEGANNSTVFTDSSSFSRAVSAVSTTPVITTTTPVRGTSSGLFSGSGGNLSISDFGLRSESFTIEAFINLSNVTGNKVIYTNYGNSTATQIGSFILGVFGTSLGVSRSGVQFLFAPTSLIANTNYYVAFTYNHSTGIWGLHLNGTLEASGTNGGLINSSAFANQIGGGLSSSNINTWRFAGRIDDLRVTKAVRTISGIPDFPYPKS